MSWGCSPPPRRIKGEPITCMKDLVDHLDCRGWVFFNHKAYHPDSIRCWSLGLLQGFVRSGALLRAEINPARKCLTPEQSAVDMMENRLRQNRQHKRQMEAFWIATGKRTEP